MVLRHTPEKIGLELDSAAWVIVEDLVTKVNTNGELINFETLVYVVETNKKNRFGFNSEKTKIRANQGHSLQIDHGFLPISPPEILFHGTGEKSLSSILEKGIERRDRHHVHLSADRETALKVGQRHGNPVVLEVESLRMTEKGLLFYKSENNVRLTDYVSVEYIKNKS